MKAEAITRLGRWLLNWKNADDSSLRAVVFEAHSSGDLREDGVVLAPSGIQAGPETAPALAHDDGAASDEVAVVRLDAQALRIGVAAVSGTALSFFMSHCGNPRAVLLPFLQND